VITSPDATQQNCFVELSHQSDHIARPNSTQQNSLVELSRVGRCDQGFGQLMRPTKERTPFLVPDNGAFSIFSMLSRLG